MDKLVTFSEVKCDCASKCLCVTVVDVLSSVFLCGILSIVKYMTEYMILVLNIRSNDSIPLS